MQEKHQQSSKSEEERWDDGGLDQCLCYKQPFAFPAIMGTHYLHDWNPRRERANSFSCLSNITHMLHTYGGRES